MSQQEIQKIYERAMIKRSQQEKEFQKRQQEELEKNFWKYVDTRIQNLLTNIMKLYQMPNVSKAQIDTAQKEFSDFLDMVNMNTLPEVIDELVLRECRNQFHSSIINPISEVDET